MQYLERKNFNRVKWLLFWIIVMQNVSFLVINAIESFMVIPMHQYFKIGLVELIAFTIPLILYIRSTYDADDKSYKTMLKLNKLPALQAVVIVVLAASGQFIMIALNAPMHLIHSMLSSQETASIAIPQTWNDLLLGFFAIVLFPSVLEELLMRGVVFGALSKQDRTVAVLFTTIMFAVLHSNISEILGILFLGAILCSVVIRTNSLYAAILYHFVSNLTALLLSYFKYYLFLSGTSIMLMFASFIIIFIICMIIFRSLTKNIDSSINKNPLKAAKQSFLSLPILLCVIITVLVQYFR